MVQALLRPIVSRRDQNDVIKFPARFNTLSFINTEDNYIIEHKAQIWAPPAVLGAGYMLSPVTDFIVIRNMSENEIVFLCTGMNAGIFDFPCYPGSIIAIPHPNPAVYPPYVRVDIALTNSHAECEIFLLGPYEQHVGGGNGDN